MSKSICKKNCLTTFMGVLFALMAVSTAEAMGPVIIRHDAHLMERDVRINIAWQSEEPIVKIIASAGKEQVIIDKDIDNERNEGGYSGVIDIVVPAYSTNLSGEQSMHISQQNMSPYNQSSMEMHSNSASQYNETIQYTLQLVDEINQRSPLLKDKAQRFDAGYAISGQRPLRDNQKALSPSVAPTISTKDPLTTALNTTIGLIGKIGSNPEIKDAKVSFWTENRVSINFNAIADKGVDKVTFEVRDALGNIAYQNSLPCSSEKQCSKQTDTFVLSPGKYMLSAVAVDTDSNNSKKMMVEFQAANTVGTYQLPTQQVQQPTITAPTSANDVPVVSIPGL